MVQVLRTFFWTSTSSELEDRIDAGFGLFVGFSEKEDVAERDEKRMGSLG